MLSRGRAAFARYAWQVAATVNGAAQIALLMIYPKNEKDDLSADERKALKQIIERWR